jgi:hypothetical protein
MLKHSSDVPPGLDEVREHVSKFAELLRQGSEESFVCKLFGIHPLSWASWKRNNPDFGRAVKEWKRHAVDRVEKTLFMKAMGYEYSVEKIMQDNDGKITKSVTTEHMTPDTNAIKYFLNNQAPREWKDRQDVHHDITGSLADAILKARRRKPIDVGEDAEAEEDFLK